MSLRRSIPGAHCPVKHDPSTSPRRRWGMGEGVIKLLELPDVRIVAIADPIASYEDDFFYKRPLGRLPVIERLEQHYHATEPGYSCPGYEDFREMLDREPSIDAIVCATPDHLHAYVSIYAMRKGKHVYCEKPLAHNIREVREMARVAAETGVATQMGNIGHARDGMREAVEWIKDGAIGPVREAHAWVGSGRWSKWMVNPPEDTPPVPEGCNWDLWLGPRPSHPYHPTLTPVRWRDYWSFGLGSIGDFVCHDMDVICCPASTHIVKPSRLASHPDLTRMATSAYWFKSRNRRRPSKSAGMMAGSTATLTTGRTM